MALVWPDVIVSEDNLFQCIREIRTALGDGRRQLVRQIQGRGYMLEAKVSAAANGVAAAGLALHRPATAPLVIAMAMLGTDQNDPLATATAAGVIGQLTHGL